ncbi:importin subunit alpha-1-like [Xenia sp. Carnegie-2017]|uniref:importin subunit alpha-1-like n=1 Tax=Xenia sp. Carnegie-2017 TaxID=2897299 RepID=UPI001F04780E|nr:importin subunit alpha-1-like [Xenia sp. Carnegie-2017]
MPLIGKENTPNRIRSFKNLGKEEDCRRRRNEVTIELRKSKRDDQILKRRNVVASEPLQENANSNSSHVLAPKQVYDILSSTDSTQEQTFTAVQATRKMLSRERNPPINDVIQAGLVPKLIECLKRPNSDIQFEAAWALTNIASGTSEQTTMVVNMGALPHFVQLLLSPNEKVREQAVWALGNIAGDGPNLRDKVLSPEYGVVAKLLELMQRNGVQASYLRNVTWTVSNLCRNKNPPPPFEAVKELLPALAYLINYNDVEVMADACWALSYLTDGPNEKIQAVINANVLPRLVSLLGAGQLNIVTPALRAVGNVVTGNDSQTQHVLDLKALDYFEALLTHKKNTLVKEAAWALSNITAGNERQIQAVIDAGLLPVVLHVMDVGDYKSQKEAVWVITNYTSGSNLDQIEYLVNACGAIPFLCKLLTVKEPKVVLVLLDAFNHILNKSDYMSSLEDVSLKIEECGGLDKLEELQQHENEQVFQMAQNLIDKYFQLEEEDLVVVPQNGDDGSTMFQFGQPTIPQTGFHF